ncbi:MAG: amidohydrolase family protein [Chloroflexota bacterium]
MAIVDMLDTGNRIDISNEILISADSHVTEPGDLWKTRLPADLRDRAPIFEDRRTGAAHSANTLDAPRPGGWDPLSRVKEMAQDGVSAEVLFPTLALRLYSLEDARLQEACFRVYNDWLAEYCQASPNRLFGIAAIAVYDIDHAIQEMERCRKAGFVGAMIWQVPHPDLPWVSDHYERFWAAAEDMDMPVNLHILTGFDYSARDRGGPIEAHRGSVNHKIAGAANTLFDIIFTGVLERHAKLNVNVVESEVGWIPFYLQQWDYYVRRFGSTRPDGSGARPLSIRMAPSEYFQRQMSATFFDDPVGGKLFSWWGAENCMWSTDYPHPNSKWPESREFLVKNLGHLERDTIQKLIRENAVKFYKIRIPEPVLV